VVSHLSFLISCFKLLLASWKLLSKDQPLIISWCLCVAFLLGVPSVGKTKYVRATLTQRPCRTPSQLVCWWGYKGLWKCWSSYPEPIKWQQVPHPPLEWQSATTCLSCHKLNVLHRHTEPCPLVSSPLPFSYQPQPHAPPRLCCFGPGDWEPCPVTAFPFSLIQMSVPYKIVFLGPVLLE
jgi:hypothetical protein